MKTDPNAPAFPTVVNDDEGHLAGYLGLTKREEFAKTQMAALTQAYWADFPKYGEPLGANWIVLRGWLAQLALEQADALIAELNKTP